MSSLAEQADRLRALHEAPELLVLPNAWDVESARRFEALGCPAVATTSAGVANAMGFAEGEAMPAAEMLDAVQRIAAAVDVPVTADLEAGYGLEPGELVGRLLEAGAVGLNLEDTDHRGDGPLVDAEAQAQRLAAVKAAGRDAGVDVVLNARVDVHLNEVGPPESRLEAAIARGRRYREAGADCVYPIMVKDEEAIAAFVEAVGAVNVLALPDAPPAQRLRELGVARLSFGSGLMHVALAAAEKLLRRVA